MNARGPCTILFSLTIIVDRGQNSKHVSVRKLSSSHAYFISPTNKRIKKKIISMVMPSKLLTAVQW